MPHWARRVDDFGPRRWHSDKKFRNHRPEYITSIIFNLIAIFILYKIPDWHFGFINEKYGVILYILIFSSLVQIGGNLLMLLLAFPTIRYLSGIFMEAASFIAMICFYYIYPLDFTNYPGLSWLDFILPWLLIIGMIVTALKVLSNIWKLIFWR